MEIEQSNLKDRPQINQNSKRISIQSQNQAEKDVNLEDKNTDKKPKKNSVLK